jgi:ABC-type maltose transport system permease subunit
VAWQSARAVLIAEFISIFAFFAHETIVQGLTMGALKD